MFLEKLTSLFDSGLQRPSRPDVKTAVAELLVAASLVDGQLDDDEVAVRDRLLKDKFDLDDASLETLLQEAKQANDNASRISHIISTTVSRCSRS